MNQGGIKPVCHGRHKTMTEFYRSIYVLWYPACNTNYPEHGIKNLGQNLKPCDLHERYFKRPAMADRNNFRKP